MGTALLHRQHGDLRFELGHYQGRRDVQQAIATRQLPCDRPIEPATSLLRTLSSYAQRQAKVRAR